MDLNFAVISIGTQCVLQQLTYVNEICFVNRILVVSIF